MNKINKFAIFFGTYIRNWTLKRQPVLKDNDFEKLGFKKTEESDKLIFYENVNYDVVYTLNYSKRSGAVTMNRSYLGDYFHYVFYRIIVKSKKELNFLISNCEIYSREMGLAK